MHVPGTLRAVVWELRQKRKPKKGKGIFNWKQQGDLDVCGVKLRHFAAIVAHPYLLRLKSIQLGPDEPRLGLRNATPRFCPNPPSSAIPDLRRANGWHRLRDPTLRRSDGVIQAR